MKTLTLIAVLFVSISAMAQETFKANTLDSISARSFADEIATSSKTQYAFLKLKKRAKRNTYTYYYIPTHLTPEEVQDQKEMGCSECMKINFSMYYEGANKDLEVPGILRLKFSNVTGSFLDLFPTWQREFVPEATHESVMNKVNDVIRKGNIRLYQFVKFNGVWEIRNNS